MSRIFLVTFLSCILLLTACGGSDSAGEDSETQETGVQQTGSSQDGAGQPGSTDSLSGQPDTGEAISMRAQELLRDGDVEAALTILEEYSASNPPSPGINELLLDAHLQYLDKVENTPGGESATIWNVLYNHYMRVLELAPDNEKALEGLDLARFWFDGRGLQVPETVDPLAFLPPDENADGETEEGSEGSKSTDEEHSDPE